MPMVRVSNGGTTIADAIYCRNPSYNTWMGIYLSDGVPHPYTTPTSRTQKGNFDVQLDYYTGPGNYYSITIWARKAGKVHYVYFPRDVEANKVEATVSVSVGQEIGTWGKNNDVYGNSSSLAIWYE